MTRFLLAAVVLGLTTLASVAARADEGPAPTLDPIQWIAAGPAQADRPGQLLVVEVWATWCGPCHATFPMLTALQRAHGDRIRVVALTDEEPARVRKFFHENREAMRIGVGAAEAASIQALLFGGFAGRGIPSAYVIREGRVLWSGPPDELSAALEPLLAPAAPPPTEAE